MPMPPLLLALVISVQAQDTVRPTTLAPIVVTATRSPLDPMVSPLPAVTLGGTALTRDVRVSVSSVVSQLPGVRALTTGEQIGKPVIRGLSGARVLVLEGGHRLEDYSWSDEDGPSVDPGLADHIELIRGPASLLYGSDAIGGVLNAIPAGIPEAAAGQRTLRWRAVATGASNNVGLNGGLGVDWAKGSWGARAQFIGRFAGNIHTPAGELENTGFGALNGEVAVGVHSGFKRASLRISRFGGEYKLLEANGPPTPPPPGTAEAGPERKTDDTRIQLDGETMWHGLRLEARTQVQSHGIIEISDDASQPGVEVETFNLGLLTTTVDLLAHHRLGAGEGTIGVSGLLSSNDTRGLVPLVPDARTNGIALFAVERLPIGRVSLLAGIRGDLRSLDADSNATLALGAQSRDYSAVTGDVGLVVRLAPGVALSGNVGRAYRAPNLFELFSNGPRLGEARYEIGDPTMVPEVSFNVDASLRWQAPNVRGELSAFHNRIDHFIFISPTSQFFVDNSVAPPDSLRIYTYGQTAQATLIGGEASVALDATPMLTLGAKVDAVRGTNESNQEPLPLMPPVRGTIEAQLHAAASAARHWYAGADAELVAEQTRLAPDDIPTAGYVLWGLSGGVVTHLASRELKLDLRLRNAANTSYRNYLSRYKEFALDAGRNLEIRVAMEF